MGWGNDGGILGRGKQMVSFGDVFCGTGGQYLKRRVAPGNWASVQVAVGPVQHAFDTKEPWNGYVWAWSSNDTLYRSTDGINWTADIDVSAVWGTSALGARSFGGSDDYLYICHCDAAGIVHRFARRDRSGTWTNNVLPTYPLNPIALCHHDYRTYDIVDYEGYVYWSHGAGGYTINRCVPGGTVWEDVGLPSGSAHQLMVHESLLFAAGKNGANNLEIYHRTSTGWYLEAEISDFGAPAADIGYISRGDDGELYAGSGATTGYVWKRVNGVWVLVGLDTGGTGSSNGMVHGGEFFHSENIAWPGGPQMRLFAPVYTVHPSATTLGMDVDGDGNALYLALIDNVTTFPVLITCGVPIDTGALGAEIYTGAAGNAINVKCNDVGRELAISGNFGANEQVESSDDGGMTWTDIDPGTWGAETAQPLLVDPDTVDGVKVALQTARAIVETTDGGATWVTRNAAVGYGPDAMARLDVDSDELVVGDAHAARKVEYSPNRGVTLQDITGGAAIGNVVALEVA